MRLICSCGCGRELKRTYDKAGNKTGYRFTGTPHDKNKRFYDEECCKKWESQRKGPVLATVNGHSTSDYEKVNQKAERLF